MSGVYPVTAQVTPIFPSAQPEAQTVKNTGLTSVYVDSGPAVSALSGYELGPGSAISWQAGKPLYAVCASGNTSQLTVLDNGGSLFDASAVAAQINAQGLAAQIASQINSQGVPGVYKTALLANSNVGLQPGASIDIDVSAWASIVVAFSGDGFVELDFYQSGLPVSGPYFSEFLTSPSGYNPRWIVPAFGGSVRFTNRSSHALIYSVYGTNRPTTKIACLGANTTPRAFTYSGAMTNGVSVALTPSDNGPSVSVFNGPVILAWNTNTISPGFVGEMFYTDISGNANANTVTGPNIYSNAQQTFNHPSIPVSWEIYPEYSSASVVINLTIIPATSG